MTAPKTDWLAEAQAQYAALAADYADKAERGETRDSLGRPNVRDLALAAASIALAAELRAQRPPAAPRTPAAARRAPEPTAPVPGRPDDRQRASTLLAQIADRIREKGYSATQVITDTGEPGLDVWSGDNWSMAWTFVGEDFTGFLHHPDGRTRPIDLAPASHQPADLAATVLAAIYELESEL